MTTPDPHRDTRLGAGPGSDRRTWLDRRRDKIVAEIERNRRGEYKVPTWVLAATLVAIIAAWIALLLLL